MSSPKRQSPISIDPYAQNGFGVRFEWGTNGAAAISAGASAMIVVDVLSFTTTLSVAVDAGIEVFPFRVRDATAATFAATRGAMLAVGRREAADTGVSLSISAEMRSAATLSHDEATRRPTSRLDLSMCSGQRLTWVLRRCR